MWQSSGNHQAVIRKSLGSHQAVIRQLLGSHQAVIKQSSGSHQAVIRQSPSYMHICSISYLYMFPLVSVGNLELEILGLVSFHTPLLLLDRVSKYLWNTIIQVDMFNSWILWLKLTYLNRNIFALFSCRLILTFLSWNFSTDFFFYLFGLLILIFSFVPRKNQKSCKFTSTIMLMLCLAKYLPYSREL